MKSFVFGHTELGLPIVGYKFGSLGPQVLILGGVHGDEIEGVVAANGLLEKFAQSFPYKLQMTLVPAFNLDGVLKKTRKNSNGVDLNRNLPSNDWTQDVQNPRYYPGPNACSESENKALVAYLKEKEPKFVLSLHSWKPLLNVNGRCKGFAEKVHEHTDYSIEEHIGYPTPGCLGTYCGLERDMPTLTYELERDMDLGKILTDHVPAIIEGLKVIEKEHN